MGPRRGRSRTAPWVGRILCVDLTTGKVSFIPTLPYALSYLGGRGLAARLAWDMVPPGIGAFDADNPLMFMPGALVGTPAPSSGRVTICSLSPQAHPHEWFTRSSLGGHWGPELKYAGYDGLVVTGRSPDPVYLWVQDDQVELRDSRELWGRGLIEAQLRLRQQLRADVRVLAIGPAGENRCRYAVIATATESAAAQGGFGAVMGSKNLKAIAVRGHHGVPIANPSEMLRRSRQVVERIYGRYGKPLVPSDDDPLPANGRRLPPCTYQCPRACGSFHRNVQGVAYPDRTYSGHFFCCIPTLTGRSEGLGMGLGFELAFEIAQVTNDLGLNHWELVFGLVPWILRCQQRGELAQLDGDRLDFDNPRFWLEFVNKIAHRQGWGDVLAEGGPRAAEALSVGSDLIGELYPAWGQSSHWDGHGSFPMPYFPYWLVPALQWAMDTRDPMGGGHGYTTNIVGLLKPLDIRPGNEPARKRLLAVGEHLYGSSACVDPLGGYQEKAAPAIFHQDRGALKDSLGLCDNIFPLLTDPKEEDLLVSVDGVEGRFLEHYLFEAAADCDISREAFYRVGTRVYAAERLLAIRNWDRSRSTDESIIPYLQHTEGSVNPCLGEKVELDPMRFRSLLDEYYALRGWDQKTARPTLATLQALEMADLHPQA